MAITTSFASVVLNNLLASSNKIGLWYQGAEISGANYAREGLGAPAISGSTGTNSQKIVFNETETESWGYIDAVAIYSNSGTLYWTGSITNGPIEVPQNRIVVIRAGALSITVS